MFVNPCGIWKELLSVSVCLSVWNVSPWFVYFRGSLSSSCNVRWLLLLATDSVGSCARISVVLRLPSSSLSVILTFNVNLQHFSDEYFFEKSAAYMHYWGPRWRSWLRHCATSQKVAGSIPDGVIGIFHWHNPSGRTMALGSTQPLTEMSTRNISWA